jgi:hypothetical protein
MTRRTSCFSLVSLAVAATLVSSWASAATPRDAGAPLPEDGALPPTQFVAQAGAIVGPGLGATVALDAHVASGLHLGAQGGFFSDDRSGYPFVGARASYRIGIGDTIRIVPTLGVAHVSVLDKDTDIFHVTQQTPISPTGGLELAAQLGHFLVGCDFQVMPVHVRRESSTQFGIEPSEDTYYLTPVAIFLGGTF